MEGDRTREVPAGNPRTIVIELPNQRNVLCGQLKLHTSSKDNSSSTEEQLIPGINRRYLKMNKHIDRTMDGILKPTSEEGLICKE